MILFLVAGYANNPEIVALLLAKGARPKRRDNQNITAEQAALSTAVADVYKVRNAPPILASGPSISTSLGLQQGQLT